MFCPPQPLLHYPSECGDDGGFDGDIARAVYAATGVPCVGVEHPRPRMLAVYFHGNSENLRTLYPFTRDLSTVLDSHVLALEYPAYYAGSAESAPSEKACFDAADRFVAHVKESTPARLPVVFFGYSMGCALALHCAHKHRGENFPAAIALLAPFVSAASVRLAHGPMALHASTLWGPLDVFAMKTAALQQGHPMIVFGAEKDEVIPPTHSAYIAKLAAAHGRCEYHLVPGATHSSIRSDRDGVVYPALLAFLDSIVGGYAGAPNEK